MDYREASKLEAQLNLLPRVVSTHFAAIGRKEGTITVLVRGSSSNYLIHNIADFQWFLKAFGPAKTPRLFILSEEAQKLATEHAAEIEALRYTGPRGGLNARYIPGWVHSPGWAITRACKLARGVPVWPWWSGSAPTPASAIPRCILGPLRLKAKELGYKA